MDCWLLVLVVECFLKKKVLGVEGTCQTLDCKDQYQQPSAISHPCRAWTLAISQTRKSN